IAWTIDPQLDRPIADQPSAPPVRPRPLTLRPSAPPPPSGVGQVSVPSHERTTLTPPSPSGTGGGFEPVKTGSGSSPGSAGGPALQAAAPPIEGLNPKYTFGNFVVGPSNQLAHAASIAAAGGGGRRHNPLFICGGTGLGKTHLVHGVAHRVRSERPGARIV